MLTPIGAAVVVTLSVLPCIMVGQTKTYEPIKTNLCEILRAPQRFNGEIVSLKGRVLIAFEDFELSAHSCERKRIDAVWLEYGRGPKRQPTTWCCGDMVPRDPLALVENDHFHKFHRYLTAQRKTKGCSEGQCYLYDVTATLVG